MLRRRTVASVLMTVAISSIPISGIALGGHSLGAYSNYFSVPSLHASAFDTITWYNQEGRHNIVSYAGDQQVASKMLYLQGDPFVSTFGGGTLLYRCTYHSRVTATGVCEGMCAAVTDRTLEPWTPKITSVSAPSSYGRVDLAGTGERWTTIEIWEGQTLLASALAGSDGKWSAPIWFTQGSHSLRIVARDVDGRLSQGAAETSVVY